MYVLNNQSQGDSSLEPRITDSEYYALPANLKDHYHDEVDEEEEPSLETELEDLALTGGAFSQFDTDDDQDTTSSTDDDSSQFDGFGGGDFGGGGSSDDY